MMKRISLILALILTITLLVIPVMAEQAPELTLRHGVLSMLNVSEEEMVDYMIAAWPAASRMAEAGTVESTVTDSAIPMGKLPKNVCIFYDSLDAMLMALNAGEINTMIVNKTTADYLCATNEQLVETFTSASSLEDNFFSALISDTYSTQNYSFMMLEGNEALRDEMNAAIADITADGTLDQLVADHIDAVIAGGDIAPVEMSKFDGADTVRVAITGSLPPIDYIAIDGTPAGFNTALLAEIGKRIGKNIELVQVDSMGRAAALASGTVDAVFWTRTNNASNLLAEQTGDELEETIEEYKTQMSEEEAQAFDRLLGLVDITDIGKYDLPEGVIITDSYYTDTLMPLITRDTMNNIAAK